LPLLYLVVHANIDDLLDDVKLYIKSKLSDFLLDLHRAFAHSAEGGQKSSTYL